ncbi:hypothetical protein ABZS76_33160 [Streptomyces sp. NPDC005562]|uniref:hypothetical protein n=1 Tax=Streptomyces sp. NPDC005562 TaxID=3154890 RepID=UPI0033AB646A
MPLSEHEQRLLLTGTLDTSGVGGSPYEELPAVALAFGAIEPETKTASEPEPEAEPEQSTTSVPEPVKEPEAKPAPKPATRKRTTSKN